MRAVKKLKNGHAPGCDNTAPEILKCALLQALHLLFQQGWHAGRVPAEWKDGIIVCLYKGKGPKMIATTIDLSHFCLYRGNNYLMFFWIAFNHSYA